MRDKDSVPIFVVLSRAYCHLCEEMIAGLRKLQQVADFELRVIDVDSDALLEGRYGELVPVLLHGERELCHYRLDEELVTDYLAEIG